MYTTEYVTIPLGELLTRVQTFKYEGLRFVQMAAETTAQGMDLFYTFYDEVNDKAITLDIYDIDETSEVPSIQNMYFTAFSYENETHDLFGVKFVNMKLDFGGHFFNVAVDSPMTVITPEQKAEREKAAKVAAAKAAKARKAAEEKSAAEADAAAAAKIAAVEAGKSAASVGDVADPAAAAAPASAAAADAGDAGADAPAAPAASAPSADDRAAKMEAKLAAMDPEKAAKVRAALAARAAKEAK